jgi:hypothetical protein
MLTPGQSKTLVYSIFATISTHSGVKGRNERLPQSRYLVFNNLQQIAKTSYSFIMLSLFYLCAGRSGNTWRSRVISELETRSQSTNTMPSRDCKAT